VVAILAEEGPLDEVKIVFLDRKMNTGGYQNPPEKLKYAKIHLRF
jgi:hypothetical protein